MKIFQKLKNSDTAEKLLVYQNKLFSSLKYPDNTVVHYFRDIFIIIISVTVIIIATDFSEKQAFYIPFPNEDLLEINASLYADSIKTKTGKYLYPVKITNIKSIKNITVMTDRKIRVISTGSALFMGDSVIVKNLFNINENLYRGNISLNNASGNRFLKFRKYIKSKLEDKLNTSGAANGLTLALISGSRKNLAGNDMLVFRKSGCSHLLALSGMHLGIISIFFFFLFKPFIGIKAALVILNLINIIYLLISGFTPSLIRAAILSAVLSYSKFIHRKIPIHRALFLTFIINILLTPDNMNDLSFQYSYLALSGIIFYAKPIYRFILRFLPPIISLPLSCSISAQIFTSVLSASVFGEIFPVGIIASVILTPLITLLMWISLLYLFIPFNLLFSPVLIFLNNKISALTLDTAAVFSMFPCIRFDLLSFILLIIFNLSVIIIFMVPNPGIKVFKRYR